MINKKTLSRLSTVQALYLYEINDKQISIEQIIKQIEDLVAGQNDYNVNNETLNYKISKSFFLKLLSFTINNIDFIDNIIKKNLNNTWSIEKLDICLLVILRVAISEFYIKITPSKVVINEFILISKEFLQDKDIGFVNSILDNINNDIEANKGL